MLDGFHRPAYAPLARALEKELKIRKGGIGLTFYEQGACVFDMWGGERVNGGDPWTRDTPAMCFSASKGIASTALHMLVDRGLVSYDDLVCKHWPEFGCNGKQDTTVRHLLTHRAGLYEAGSIFSHADEILDWDRCVAALAAAKPAHAPGARVGYHALTFGHLVGEVVRRVSGKEFSAFIQSDLAGPLGLENFHIGAPPEAAARAATNARGPGPLMNTREGKKPRRRSALQRTAVKLATGALNAVGVPIDLARTGRAFGVEGIGNWDPTSAEFLGAAIPAINGIFSAPDLARMYAALSLGGEIDGVRLLSERTLREASRVREPGPDAVLVMPMNWSLGYHSVITRTGPSKTGFGHLGLCGTGGWADMKKRLAMGMTANWTFQGPREQYTSFALTLAALGCARKGGARHAT